jgi:Ribosomal protein L23
MRLVSGTIIMTTDTLSKNSSLLCRTLIANLIGEILISPVNAKRNPPQALLYVPPKMTKTEVKEYLTKIYNVNVLDVMTANFLGE